MNLEFLITTLIIIVIINFLHYIFNVKTKKIKKLAVNKKLDELANKFPENLEICQKILKKLNNEKVKIETDEESKTSMFIVIADKIQLGAIDKTFTRIQTIAHECLHSIQDRKMLMFNFIYSNIYMLLFLVLAILLFAGNSFIIENKHFLLILLTLMGFVYYVVRSYLEIDAMTKARYVAKEYMEEEKILKQEEINEMVNEYDKLNDLGIKATNYSVFLMAITPIIIFSLICFFK